LRSFKFLEQATRQHDGRHEVHLKHVAPHSHRRFNRVQALSTLCLWRNTCIVDERVQLAAIGLKAAADFSNGFAHVFLVRKVNLDVIFRSRWPRTILSEILTRAGDDAPASARKTLNRRMTNATACPCQNKGFTFRICLGSIRPGRIGWGNCRHDNLTLNL
jgi:hypothetical protein